MTVMQIPEGHLVGFKALAALRAKEYKVFRGRLKSLAPAEGALRLKDLQEQLKAWSSDEESVMVNAIIGLFMNLISSDELDDDFLGSFIKAYETQSGEKNSELLKKRIVELFDEADGLRCTLKGVSLIREAEHLYSSSRIFTDVRPVFNNSNSSTRGNHAIIMHRLKLVRDDSHDQRSTYLSMTRSQLEDLRKVIDRALEKDSTLREQSGFRFID